jgi:ankyrin repeat protein
VACAKGSAAAAQLFLQRYPLLDPHRTGVPCSAMYIAAYRGHADVVHMLLHQRFLDPNEFNVSDSETPLFGACKGRHPDVIHELACDARVNPNLRHPVTTRSVLFQSCFEGNVTAIRGLLEEFPHIDVNMEDVGWALPFFSLCVGLKRSVSCGVPVVQLTTNVAGDIVPHHTPLYAACRNGHIEVVLEMLLAPALDINRPSTENEETPFFVACETGQIELVEALLRHPDIDANLADVCTTVPSPPTLVVFAVIVVFVKSSPQGAPRSTSPVSVATKLYWMFCWRSAV